MKKMILGLLAALLMAVGLTVAVSSPAQALGWSGQRCDSSQYGPSPKDGWRVCVQVHTVATSGGFVWVDSIQVCQSMYYTNNHVTNLFNNGWSTNAGNWGGLPNVPKGTCQYASPTKASATMAGGTCLTASGRQNRTIYPDTGWQVRMFVQGGAC